MCGRQAAEPQQQQMAMATGNKSICLLTTTGTETGTGTGTETGTTQFVSQLKAESQTKRQKCHAQHNN